MPRVRCSFPGARPPRRQRTSPNPGRRLVPGRATWTPALNGIHVAGFPEVAGGQSLTENRNAVETSARKFPRLAPVLPAVLSLAGNSVAVAVQSRPVPCLPPVQRGRTGRFRGCTVRVVRRRRRRSRNGRRSRRRSLGCLLSRGSGSLVCCRFGCSSLISCRLVRCRFGSSCLISRGFVGSGLRGGVCSCLVSCSLLGRSLFSGDLFQGFHAKVHRGTLCCLGSVGRVLGQHLPVLRRAEGFAIDGVFRVNLEAKLFQLVRRLVQGEPYNSRDRDGCFHRGSRRCRRGRLHRRLLAAAAAGQHKPGQHGQGQRLLQPAGGRPDVFFHDSP